MESEYMDQYFGNDMDSYRLYSKTLKGLNLEVMTKEEEHQLAIKAKSGDEISREEFLKKNLRLVISIAKHYTKKGLPFIDLIQEGNMGLMKALDCFDPYTGHKFSTYATWWIKQYINRAIHVKARQVRLPVHTEELLSKVNMAYSKLENKLGRKPEMKELAKFLNMPIEKLEYLLSKPINTISINTNFFNDDGIGVEFSNLIPSDFNLENEVIREIEKQEIQKLLTMCELTNREIFVLRLRFGFDDDKSKTLEEIGGILGVTRECIRQIEKSALNKIKRPEYIKLFVPYLSEDSEIKKKYQKNPNFFTN